MNKTNLRIIVYALLVCLILNGFLYLYDMQNLPFSTDIMNFVLASVTLISHFSLALVAGTMIITWISKFTTKKPITYLSIVGLIGCVICFYNVIIPLINHKQISKIQASLMVPFKQDNLSSLSAMINDKNMPLEKRAMVSRMIAESKYATSGILSEFVNDKGESQVYIPSKSEIERRDQLVRSDMKTFYSLHMAKIDIYYRIIFWLSVFFFSMGFSLVNRKNI